jgi:L-ribulose-5-phosphate 3-epimerase
VIEATFINDEVSRDLDEAIAFARAEGIAAIELRLIGDTNVVQLPWPQLHEVRRKLVAAGLGVAALSTPLFKCPLDGAPHDDAPDPFRAASHDFGDHLALIPRATAVAAFLGTARLRCFAFLGSGTYEEARVAILERLRLAGAEAMSFDPSARLCIENEPSTYVRSAADVGSLVRELGAPFEVLWDPGNAYFAGERAPRLGFDHVADLVTHIHVKDPRTEDGAMRFVPVGQGEIDYAAQTAAWAESGYTGFVSLEPHIMIGSSSLDGARACLDYLRPLLAAADAGGRVGDAADPGVAAESTPGPRDVS